MTRDKAILGYHPAHVMTGGAALSFFILVAIATPLVLNVLVVAGHRNAPVAHRWYLRHARRIEWSLAVMFAIMMIVTMVRSGPINSHDPLALAFGPGGGRWFLVALFAVNTFDHGWRAVKAGRQAPQNPSPAGR